LLPFGCHFFVIFCHFVVIFVSFVCHFCIVFSSSPGGWIRSRAGKAKNAISPARRSFFFVIFLSFSQASGEGGKPGLGKAKKNAKK
jgi:hypothetical protein